MIVEIRAGEGGDDSKKFVHELAEAYILYAQKKRLKCEILSSDESFLSLQISGDLAGKIFLKESGKHAVQRRPKNGKGRPHASVVTVAVMPLHEMGE